VYLIRLSRTGARKQPLYRIGRHRKERARNGLPVEVVGTYNPRTNLKHHRPQARPAWITGFRRVLKCPSAYGKLVKHSPAAAPRAATA